MFNREMEVLSLPVVRHRVYRPYTFSCSTSSTLDINLTVLVIMSKTGTILFSRCIILTEKLSAYTCSTCCDIPIYNFPTQPKHHLLRHLFFGIPHLVGLVLLLTSFPQNMPRFPRFFVFLLILRISWHCFSLCLSCMFTQLQKKHITYMHLP